MTSSHPRTARIAWQRSASSLALSIALVHAPAAAQTAAVLRASAGLTSPVVTAPAPVVKTPAVAPNAAGMQSASARAIANQAALANAQSLGKQANDAARAAARLTEQTVGNGLVRATLPGVTPARAAGLVPVAETTTAALDPTGLRIWEGAGKPVQTGSADAPTVTIDQTSQRALLSWESFNVGRDTTLVFNQQPGWVAFNRIVANIDPATGRIADFSNLRPSQILGTIKADGTVVVINQNGVMFGATAQVNVRSLLVSTLEIGARSVENKVAANSITPTSLSERSATFLQSGLLAGNTLVSGLVTTDATGVNIVEPPQVEGSVSIAAGANLSSASGGYVIIAAPNITNAGQLRSEQGQVSLQSGRQVFATASTGAAASVDPEVRGLVLSSLGISADSVTNTATGVIEAPRGYISLGATETGKVNGGGVLTATTSVARNGKIVLSGAAVTLAPGTTIAITPDTNGEKIPQGADSVAAFKRSVIEIGGAQARGTVSPSQISIGADSLIYAPSARVSIGATNDTKTTSVTDDGQALASSLTIANGVRIDVGGIKDFVVPAARNSIEIAPVKRNELRDTPNYREASDNGGFTLNGTTLFVDPRLSGVRDDGVAWIGSPLIEAGSYYAQIGVTAAELMLTGGDLTLGVRSFAQGSDAAVPSVTVGAGAVLDVSGGWLRYEEGVVKTSRLRTADGRIVEIGKANPNDVFVGVVAPITTEQPRFGASTTFANQVAQNFGFETGYTEGRDAGSLTIKASTTTLAGSVHGEAFAGTRQIASSQAASAAPKIAGDQRRLQATARQLPSGGLLKIAAIGTDTDQAAGGADIIVYRGDGAVPARRASEILLADTVLSGAGLSGLTLQTSGRVDFTGGSSLTLADGGGLQVDAGRSIRFGGTIAIASGRIAARTYEVVPGSVFRDDDDLPETLADDAVAARLFDIEVDGRLSTRGRWSNDSLVSNGAYLGSAYTDGGSISLQVAPRVLIPIGDGSAYSADFSGSIHINSGASLDVTAGGYVAPEGTVKLDGRGGNVALINETIYAQLQNAPNIQPPAPARSELVNAPAFITSPSPDRQSSLMPRAFAAEVTIAPGAIAAQGFASGGTFTLVTPDLNFGARTGSTGTALPLDFFTSSGFARFDVTSYHSRLLANPFSNGITGNIALLDTEIAGVGRGETLRLTQSLLNALPDDGELAAARKLATGGDIGALLGPAVPAEVWDQRPVSLRLAGLTELNVAAGGTILGSPGAALTASKLRNAGTIRLPGGTIRQEQTLPDAYVTEGRAAIAIADESGFASIFGPADENGLYDENALNALGIRRSASSDALVLTNAELTTGSTFSRQVYFTGEVAADTGISLARGSITDVSGVSIRNPRAGARPGGEQKITGRIIGGGTIETAAPFAGNGQLLSELPLFGLPRYIDPTSGNPLEVRRRSLLLTAEASAQIDIGGATDSYHQEVALGVFALSPVWSNAGRLTLNGGGSVAGSSIRAVGGSAKAEGGVLTWRDPVLRQGGGGGLPLNVVSADQIMASGFGTFVALNKLTTAGDASLTLARGFYLVARPYDGNSAALDVYRATLATTGALRINAPYIHLASPQQTVLPTPATGSDTGTVTLSARSIDIVGSVYADPSVTRLTLNAINDVRLTGVQPEVLGIVGSSRLPVTSSLSGQFVVSGDLTINAAQVYATTGTGSLQQDIDALRAGKPGTAVPYLVASTGEAATIRFGSAGASAPTAPWSAGSNLLVQAANIVQGGVVRAPLGRLTLGSNTPVKIGTSLVPAVVPATLSLSLEPGSTTSVSANGLNIPYGTTTDLIEYFFTPTSDGRLFAPPAAELRLAGGTVNAKSGATVDASGGGDLYAYEFAAGIGGSRDVLSRFNSDPFSGNDGLQFPDGRQVYAIVPSLADANIALVDPIYSADYTALTSQSDAGRRVYLEAAPGLSAGWYTLLPARYALLPGGMRVVERVGEEPPAPGINSVLRDGTLVVGGHYGVAGTGIESSERLSFTVQSQDTFRNFSKIQLTPASKTFTNLAKRDGLTIAQLPADAARLVLAPLTALAINTKFLTTPGEGGRGAQIDIAGNAFEIVVPGAPDAPEGVIRLTSADFSNLNAASLLIGGIRSDAANGTTTIVSTTQSIVVANNAANPLTAPEILLAVDGVGSSITIADGAVITATGTLADTRTGSFVITASEQTGQTAIGGVVRVANGPERLLARPGALALANSGEDSSIRIGEATLSGQAILLDSSRDLVITDNPLTAARPLITASNSLALGGDDVFFTTAPSGYRGLVITPDLEAQFAAAERLTITTKSIIGFAGGTHSFKDLRIDARGIRPYGQVTTPPPFPRDDQFDVPVADPTAPIAVTLNTRNFSFANSDIARTPCEGTGVPAACGATGNSLLINATSISFGSGPMGIFGFDANVGLVASEGIYVEGVGTIDLGRAALQVSTPYFGDRALVADPRGTKVQPSLGVLTKGKVALSGTGTAAPTVAEAPGSTLTFGSAEAPVASFTANGIALRATAGVLDVRSTGDIVVTGASVLSTPGYAKSFGDAADRVTISAPGGTLSLVSLTGNVDLGRDVRLSIGGGSGSAGTLQLSAAQGRVVLPGTIDAVAPDKKASLRLNSGTAGFNLAGFLTSQNGAFGGDIRVRTGTGDLEVGAGQLLVAQSVRLTADGGAVNILGTIDTSGINGGAIGLFGTAGVTLASTARLDASADGYAADDTRAATGGTIEIGTAGGGAIVVASGAVIDVAARRPGARLIKQLRKDALTLNDTVTYNYAQSDTGGLVSFRAPVVLDELGKQTVNISYTGTIAGAREVTVEGYRVYDLRSMALASCADADICINDKGQAILDLNAAEGSNRLASTQPGTIPDFIRKFDLSAATGLGALAADPNVRLRPGVQLEYSGDIVLASNWNLGAATVDQEAAIADGLMAPSPQLRSGLNYVVAGKEAELFSGFSTSKGVYYTDFVYRVGGRASGEAGVLTLRAGGDLDIRGSITDGFFNFNDKTDPTYLSFQLGGGDRQYLPALNVSCGSFSTACTDLFTPFDRFPGASAPPYPLTDIVNIAVNRLVRGPDIVDRLGEPVAPYSAAANSPGALGNDPIGSASLMPLLADGSPAASFSLRLVAGAAADGAATLAVSADPMAVAPSSDGTVRVSGERTYRAAPDVVTQKYAGDLQLSNFDPNQGAAFVAEPDQLIAKLAEVEVTLDPTTYTRLTLTGATPAIRSFFVTAAKTYFAENGIAADQYQFFGPANNPTILAASFDLIARVLQSVSKDFSSRIGPAGLNYAGPNPAPATTLNNPNITTRSLIRTGTGSIDVAAAGDVDLTNGRAVFRAANGRVVSSGAVSGAQVGGTAIYTAGHIVAPGQQMATVTASGQSLAVDAGYSAITGTNASTLPNLQGVLANAPVYASGGGDIRISSGRDVLARRDAWAESFRGVDTAQIPIGRFRNAGTDTQLWRPVAAPDLANRFSQLTNIRINAQLFSSGVGALGGGSIQVDAGRNISQLTAVSDTSVTTALVTDAAQPDLAGALAMVSFGGGNVALRAGGNVLGSQVDVASGQARVSAGGSVGSAGLLRLSGTATSPVASLENNLLRLRVADGTTSVTALRSITVGGIGSTDGDGFFGRTAGVSLLANGDVSVRNQGKNLLSQFSITNDTTPRYAGALLPGSLEAAALFGNINLSDAQERTSNAAPIPVVLVPSPVGQLRLYAGGDLAGVTLAMDDGDPSLTPGPLSAATQASLADINTLIPGTRLFGFPVTLPNTTDAARRLLHNERTTHAGDREPVRIYADGDINQVTLSVPKQTRISAGGDIVDMIFIGQNIEAGDVTRITAGRDIVATSRVISVPSATGSANLPVLQGNNFVLGGPGAIYVEAGRDLGPFFNSATVGTDGSLSYAGGIITVGNDYNPWLQQDGAKIYVGFGVGKGANYDALRATYVDPTKVNALDGDLFVQELDENGNRRPVRSKPIYASALVGWLVENQPDAVVAAFGAPITLTPADVLPLFDSLDPAIATQFLIDLPYLPLAGGINSPTVAIDRTSPAAPRLKTGSDTIDAPSAQRTTISGSTLIGWLAQNAPDVLKAKYGVTSTDIGRAYAQLTALPQLTQQQFLLDRVYFNELTAPSRPDGASSQQYIRGYRAVDLLFPGANGYTANDLGGTTNGGTRIETGNLDLRLATLETQRGGDITILGPGGRVLGGSVVATSAQASRRGSEVRDPYNLFQGVRRRSFETAPAFAISSIPPGFEGVLTLRGGSVRGFTDADFLLNQSRLFTLAGGDVTLWSSNGDLNAGQGVKTSANNPPVVVRFDPNAVGTLDQAGTVAGAGIAALQPAGVDKAPDVSLIAPVGTVDAGDAGVRASGNVFVAAARVANADNFKVGGTAFGNIAGTVVDTGAAASANAASAAAAQAAAAVNPSGSNGGQDRSRITVEVLGFAGKADEDPCNQTPAPANCPVAKP